MSFLDLNSISNSLARDQALKKNQARQMETTQARQQAELEVARQQAESSQRAALEASEVQSQSFQSAAANREEQLALLGLLDENVRKATHAMELTDSGNPMDRVMLWALQQVDPAYTRSGNAERIQYLTSTADAMGYAEEIRQSGFADQLTQIKNMQILETLAAESELGLLRTMETQGQELIDLQIQNQQDRMTFLTQSNAMQQQAIANLTPEQIRDMEKSMLSSGQTEISAGGVTLSLAQVQDRRNQLDDRDWALYVRDLERQNQGLQNLTLADVTALEREALAGDGTATVNGQSVPLARLQERKLNLQSQSVQELLLNEQVATVQRQMSLRTQEKILDSMSVVELNQLAANGGDMGDGGPRFDLDLVTARRDSLLAAQDTALQADMAVQAMGDPLSNITSHMEYLDQIQANTQPGSALYNSIERSKRSIRLAANWAQETGPDAAIKQLASQSAVASSYETIEAAIDSEALRLAGGNQDLARLVGFQLRGMPAPVTLVEDFLLSAVKKGQSIDAWLPTESRAMFKNTFQQVYADLTSPTNFNRYSKSEAEQIAAEQALAAVRQAATQGLTEMAMGYQVGMDGNPLRGVMDSTELLNMMARSDIEGAAAYQEANGLSDEDMEARLSGQIADTELVKTQTAHFFMALEAAHPGMAKAYRDWWVDGATRQQFGAGFTAFMDAQNAGNTQDLASWSLIRGDVQTQMGNIAMGYDAGYDLAETSAVQQRFTNFATFNGTPAHQQAYLLSVDPSLSDNDRSAIFSGIIQPMLAEAEAQGLDPSETTAFIDRSLRTFTPADANQRRLFNLLMPNRVHTMLTLDNFYNANALPGGAWGRNVALDRMVGGGNFLTNPAETAPFQWYRDLIGE